MTSSATIERRTRFLAEHGAFLRLTRDAVRRISAEMRPLLFRAGDRVIRQGDVGDGLHLITRGEAAVRLNTEDGKTLELATVGRGDVVGEMALVSGETRTADVVAKDNVSTLFLPSEAFRAICDEHIAVAEMMTNLVADRLGGSTGDAVDGKVFGGHRLRRPLGQGGMAVVYEAESLEDGRRVALKMMSHRLVLDPNACRRFEEEAELVESLSHPAVTNCYGRFAAFGTQFMVMEFCEGPTLHEVVERVAPLPSPLVASLVRALADGLEFVHGHGLVHADIKPANVLLAKDGNLKITDFGIATAFHGQSRDAERPVVGTPQYMAPELFRFAAPHPSADIYALGCLAYELLVGRLPFQGTDLASLIAEKTLYRLPAALPVGRIEPSLRRFLELSLDASPERRAGAIAALEADPAPLPPALLARVRA